MLFVLEKQKSGKYIRSNEADAVTSEYIYTNMVFFGEGRGERSLTSINLSYSCL